MTTSPATNPSNVHLPDPKLTQPWIRELDWITLWRMPNTQQNSEQVRSNMETYTDMEIHLDFRAYKRGSIFKIIIRAPTDQHFGYFLDIQITGHLKKCCKIGHFNPTDTDWILKILGLYHTWATGHLKVDGLRKKLSDEIVCFSLMNKQCCLLSVFWVLLLWNT